MAAFLELKLLGTPEVWGVDLSIDSFPTQKCLALLFYVATTGRIHSRAELATLLWGDTAETKARTNLRGVLKVLRRLVGEHLLIDRQRVAFNQSGPHTIDVVTFKSMATLVSADLGEATSNEMADLYRGDFLYGFQVRGAPDFENWMLIQRAQFRQLAVNAYYRLTEAFSDRGEIDQSIHAVRQLLNLEPWHEEGHRRLMALLAQSGQRSAALTQYTVCREVLADELDVEPSDETVLLYEQIRSGQYGRETQLSFSEQDPTTVEADGSVVSLPTSLTSLIGRTDEMAELDRLLKQPECRLVTILGPGGIGKSHLALEVAARQFGTFSHGVYFAALASVDGQSELLSAIARSLDFTFYKGTSPQAQLQQYLLHKSVLLVLDNFEHLIDEAALLTKFLRAAPGLKILTTSRVRLNITGEQVFPLSGLDFPDAGTPGSDRGPEPSAVQLFVDSAQRIRPVLTLSDHNRAAIQRICGLVQGMPLAILLASSWTALLSPDEIADRLTDESSTSGQRLDFLQTESATLDSRQRNLRHVFDNSWQLMSREERAVFKQMSVFRGGFTLNAAEAVTGSSLVILRSLINKSLLQRNADKRFEIHELLRQYAAERLEADTDAALATRERHASYYCRYVQRREKELRGPDQLEALDKIEADSQNARAAWRWASRQSKYFLLDQAIDSLGRFYQCRAHFQEGKELFEQTAELLGNSSAGDTSLTLARVLTWQAIISRHQVSLDSIEQLFDEALNILEQTDVCDRQVPHARAFLLHHMGETGESRDIEAAQNSLNRSLSLYQKLGDRWGEAHVMVLLGNIAWSLGRHCQAKQFLADGLGILRTLSDQKGIIQALDILGLIAKHEGELEEAESLHREALDFARTASDKGNEATMLTRLGITLIWAGKYEEAISTIEKSIVLATDLGMRDVLGLAHLATGNALNLLGQYKAARVHADLSLHYRNELGQIRTNGLIEKLVGRICLGERKYCEAQKRFTEAIVLLRDNRRPALLAEALACMGFAAYHIGDPGLASKSLVEAVRIATDIGVARPLWCALAAAALHFAANGQYERAIELYALARRHPHVANSRWFEDVAGRHVAVAAKQLPAEVANAAQEQGRNRDLWATADELLHALS